MAFTNARARWSAVKLLALTAIGLVGCGLEPDSFSEFGNQPANSTAVSPSSSSVAADDTIRIASFNIQVFGQLKLAKPHVMEVLADIVRKFDIVAIQEVRSKEQNVLPDFLTQINANGVKYDFVLGPRQGRTVSQEQYAYVYDTTRLELMPDVIYVPPDPEDLLHRPPLVARFRVRGPPETSFSFLLANIHTDPDDTRIELDALADVFQGIQQRHPEEDDVILLGDLNVDEYKLGRLGELPGIQCAILGQPTNTRLNKTYDNIVFDRRATAEFLGRSGVLNIMEAYGLSPEQALEVSDHLPIWAEFSAAEVRGPIPVARIPQEPAR